MCGLATLLALGCSDDDESIPAGTAGAGGSAGATAGGSGGSTAGSAGSAAGTAGTAGSGGVGPIEGDPHPDCDVLSDFCGFPFPSNYYLADDPTGKNPSGKRVQFGATTLPVFMKGKAEEKQIGPEQFYRQDGFSPGQGPLYRLAGATTTGLPAYDKIEDSLKPTSPTVLMEAETGELVPHFAELDVSGKPSDHVQQPLIIRPVVRLKDGTRYIVAIRNVVDASGKAIPPLDSFKALRDETPTNQAAIESRREAYKDIFEKLAKAGVQRDNLQIAWDYTTSTREGTTSWLLHMRDDALAKVGEMGPTYTVKAVEDDPAKISDKLKARVVLSMKVPLYLDQAAAPGKLNFGPDGMPAQNGEAEYEVLVLIPKTIDETAEPHGILANGHGLLGDKREGQGGYLATMCNRHKYVAVAVDFIGFAEEDQGTVLDALGANPDLWINIVDRQHQGHLNGQLAMRMMRGRIATEGLTHEGKVLIPPGRLQPDKAFYRGDSQGGIMGGVYMAISKDVTRGLLGEPGMPYNLLLNRSKDYSIYDLILRGAYPDMRSRQIILGLFQMYWDRTEPNGYVPYINTNLLPDTPQHEILLHVAIGDYQVPPLGAHIMARSLNAKNLAPVNRSIYGIPEDPGPFNGSAMVEYDFALKDSPVNTGPNSPDGQDPHDIVRQMIPSYDQSNHFFQTGEIKGFCDGACDCGDVLADPGLSDGDKASCKAAQQ